MCAAGGVPQGLRLPARDRTSSFVQRRREKRAAQDTGYGLLPGSDPLVDSDGGGANGPSVKVPVAELPPEWVDYAEQARDELKGAREELVLLTKAQQRRLLQVFKDDDAPDEEVERSSRALANAISQCTVTLRKVSAGDGGAENFRKNVQIRLATELQQLSKESHQVQRDYIAEIRKRSAALKGDAEANGHNDGLGASGQDARDGNFSAQQMAVLEDMEISAANRSAEITMIAASIHDLHNIFKELSAIVVDQGTIVDRIDYNVEKVLKKAEEGRGQLEKTATARKKSAARAVKCIVFLLLVDFILLLCLIVKYKFRYGWSVLGILTFLFCTAGLCLSGLAAAWYNRPQFFSGWQNSVPDRDQLKELLRPDFSECDPRQVWSNLRPPGGPFAAARAAGRAASAAQGASQALR